MARFVVQRKSDSRQVTASVPAETFTLLKAMQLMMGDKIEATVGHVIEQLVSMVQEPASKSEVDSFNKLLTDAVKKVQAETAEEPPATTNHHKKGATGA